MNKPTLVARFELDAVGRPRAIEEGGVRHYEIELHVDGAPRKTFGVTYTLHDTYLDPVREVASAGERGFPETITSYGDYRVRAKVRSTDQAVPVSAKLSEALRRGHAGDLNDNILQAITEIEES